MKKYYVIFIKAQIMKQRILSDLLDRKAFNPLSSNVALRESPLLYPGAAAIQ